ncbi:MAG: hypothetical protein RSD49_04790 [Hafnia sp.]
MARYILEENESVSCTYHWPVRSSAGETIIIEFQSIFDESSTSRINRLDTLVIKAINQVKSALNYALPYIIVREFKHEEPTNHAHVLVNWMARTEHNFQLTWQYLTAQQLTQTLSINFQAYPQKEVCLIPNNTNQYTHEDSDAALLQDFLESVDAFRTRYQHLGIEISMTKLTAERLIKLHSDRAVSTLQGCSLLTGLNQAPGISPITTMKSEPIPA